jgi:hypothetical protein
LNRGSARARTRTFSPAKHPSTSDAMCLKTPRLRRSDCSVGRSTSMSSFTRVATGPRLPHPARSSRESAAPLVLAILASYVLRPRARAVGDTRAVDRRRRTRLPGRPSARRATRARTLTSRSPFERPNAGGTHARPRAPHPHPKDSILSLSRARSAQLVNGGGCPRPYLAHRPRGVLVSPGAPPGVPVSSRAKSLSVQPTPLATVASTTHWRRRHGLAVLIVFERRDLQPIFWNRSSMIS